MGEPGRGRRLDRAGDAARSMTTLELLELAQLTRQRMVMAADDLARLTDELRRQVRAIEKARIAAAQRDGHRDQQRDEQRDEQRDQQRDGLRDGLRDERRDERRDEQRDERRDGLRDERPRRGGQQKTRGAGRGTEPEKDTS